MQFLPHSKLTACHYKKQFMLFREIITVCCENRMKYVNRLLRKCSVMLQEVRHGVVTLVERVNPTAFNV